MDALPFTPVELVAVDAARNIHRRWRIAAYRDLFGALVVETAWGRVGQGGRRLMRQFEREADALRYVRALLVRRRGSPARIGVAYRSPPHVDTSTGGTVSAILGKRGESR